MKGDGFTPKPHDSCVFTKHELDGEQVAVAIRVDDISNTSKSEDDHKKFEPCMCDKYKEIKISKEKVADYIGITFAYIVPAVKCL
jgi:hypothetical protein